VPGQIQNCFLSAVLIRGEKNNRRQAENFNPMKDKDENRFLFSLK
jgi:hypothetical protein